LGASSHFIDPKERRQGWEKKKGRAKAFSSSPMMKWLKNSGRFIHSLAASADCISAAARNLLLHQLASANVKSKALPSPIIRK